MSRSTNANDQWIPLQIKVFTRWFNSQLKNINENEIQSIISDLSNGVSLVQIVQFLTKKNPHRAWKKNPTRNIDMVQNCDLAIEMLQKDGVHVIGISGKDVNDKNEKLILGLIWLMISHYSINTSLQDGSSKNGSNALLKWAIERTSNYKDVSKFQPYQLAICALLDSYVPEKINYNSLNPNDSEKNIKIASNVMKDLGIPVYIYDEDIMKNNGKVDDKTLLTQLAAAKIVLDALSTKPKTVEPEIPKIPPKVIDVEDEPKIPPKVINVENETKPDEFAKKEFSPDDPSGDDVFSYCYNKEKNKFLVFACIGEMGSGILNGDRNFHWESTENKKGNTEFNIGIRHYSLRLKTLRMFTGSDKYPEKAPKNFYLYGYNSHLKVWDVIYIFNGNRLETRSCYDFNIVDGHEKIPYRIFSLSTTTGPFALAYIKFFGELVSESDELSIEVINKPDVIVEKNITFNCIREPGKYTEGIFRAATKYYGPNILYFANTDVNSGYDDGSVISDIWNERNRYFKSVKLEDRSSILTFDFVHHEVFLTGYQIRPLKNTMTSWCIVGFQNNDDYGVILDQRLNKVLDDEDSIYSFEFNNNPDPNKSFRIIRVFGLNKYLAFRYLDFFGKAIPARDLTKDEYNSSFNYTGDVTTLFNQVNGV